MNKFSVFSLLLVLIISGCGGKRKNVAQKKVALKSDQFSEVSIPVADNSAVKSFFDDEIGEFTLIEDDDARMDELKDEGPCIAETLQLQDDTDFSWVEEEEKQQDLKVVYFDFDKYAIRSDQEAILADNIECLKKMLQEADGIGQDPTIVIEGHACSSAGSRVYNLALSEKRAEALIDRLVSAGISRSKIKIVGRGQEVPAVVDGRPVVGDRDAQWPNRRDEIRIIYA